MKLTRTEFTETGIFGVLTDENSQWHCFTLEHAYPCQDFPNTFVPKLPPGTYTCQRGMHQLEGMAQPFETFEITNVPGHTNILFHTGNTNADSAGCVLLGTERQGNSSITCSRIAFDSFIKLLEGIDSFELTVL